MRIKINVLFVLSLLSFNINATTSDVGDTYLLAKTHDEALAAGKKTFLFIDGKTYKVQPTSGPGNGWAPLLSEQNKANNEAFTAGKGSYLFDGKIYKVEQKILPEYNEFFVKNHNRNFRKGECTFQYPTSGSHDNYERYPIGNKLLNQEMEERLPRKMNSIKDISDNTIKTSFSTKKNNHIMELKFGKLDAIVPLRFRSFNGAKIYVSSGPVKMYLNGGERRWGNVNRYWIDDTGGGGANTKFCLTNASFSAGNTQIKAHYAGPSGAKKCGILYLFDINNNKGSFIVPAKDWNFDFKILYDHVPKKDKQQINTKCYVDSVSSVPNLKTDVPSKRVNDVPSKRVNL